MNTNLDHHHHLYRRLLGHHAEKNLKNVSLISKTIPSEQKWSEQLKILHKIYLVYPSQILSNTNLRTWRAMQLRMINYCCTRCILGGALFAGDPRWRRRWWILGRELRPLLLVWPLDCHFKPSVRKFRTTLTAFFYFYSVLSSFLTVFCKWKWSSDGPANIY